MKKEGADTVVCIFTEAGILVCFLFLNWVIIIIVNKYQSETVNSINPGIRWNIIIRGLFLRFDGLFSSLPVFMVIVSILFLFPCPLGKLRARFSSLLSFLRNAFRGQVLLFRSLIFFRIQLFFVIIILNRFRLLPYVYCLTALPSFSLTLSLQVWIWVILRAAVFRFKDILVHFTPKGAPSGLASVLVLIEIIRNVIRVITLGVRLLANLTRGHIIVALIARINITRISWTSQILLLVLEILVSIIQAYVFSILTYLYIMET